MLIKLNGHVLRTLVAALSLVLVAGAATVASAAPRIYAELLTSDQMWVGPTDARITVDADLADWDENILLGADVEYGAGLGDGYLRRGDWLSYSHTFDPVGSADSIIAATLSIAVADDQWGDRTEAVMIGVNGDFWQSGWATFRIFDGDVTAVFIDDNGQIRIDIVAVRGDLNVLLSTATVLYEDGSGSTGSCGGTHPGTVAVPEPGGLALFCAGILAVGRVRRKDF